MQASSMAVRRFIGMMLPKKDVRERCLRQYLKSIIAADDQGPDKWGVHFKSDRDKVRLLVGNLIVATLCPQGLWMTLDESVLPKADSGSETLLDQSPDWTWDSGDYPRYRAVPSRNGYFFPTSGSPEVATLLEASHHEYITKVGRKFAALNVRSQRLHDDSVLRFLGDELGEFVPRPEYQAVEATEGFSTRLDILEESLTSDLPDTEREAIRLSRVGQGRFRRRVKQYWSRCSVTGCELTSLLRASHIKPWRHADNRERLDLYNGLLLVPNLDAAFDEGLISFTDQGQIIISSSLSTDDARKLGIHRGMKVVGLHSRHQEYLAYHRSTIFRK
jgi:hypothetical protein